MVSNGAFRPPGLEPDDVGEAINFDNIFIDGEQVSLPYLIDSEDDVGSTGTGHEVNTVFRADINTDQMLEFTIQFTTDRAGTGFWGSVSETLELDQDSQSFRLMTRNRRELENEFNVITGRYAYLAGAKLPLDEIENAPTLAPDIELGELTDDSIEIPYRQVILPNRDELREQVNEMDPVEIVAVAQPGNVLEGVMADLFGQMGLKLEMPPNIFVRWVDVDDLLPCTEQYEDIINSIDNTSADLNSLRNDSEDVLSTLNGMMSKIENISGFAPQDVIIDRDDIGDVEITQDGFSVEDSGGIIDIDDARVLNFYEEDYDVEITEDELESWQDAVSQASDVVGDGESVLSEFNELDDRIESEVGEECMDEIRDTFDESFDDVDGFAEDIALIDAISTDYEFVNDIDPALLDARAEVPQELQGRVNDFIDRVENLDSPVDGDVIEEVASDGEDLISDIESDLHQDHPEKDNLIEQVSSAITESREFVPKQLTNQVEQFITAVEEVSTPVREDRLSNLMSEGEDVIDSIESELDPQNPAKSELESRVRDAMTDLDRLDVIRREDVPCSETYPGIDDALEEIEVAISRIQRADVEPDGTIPEPIEGFGSINELLDEIEGVAGDVEQNVDRAECITEFRDRIDSLTSQAEARMTGVRVDDDAIEEIESRRDELRQRLSDRLEGVEGDLPDDVEDLSDGVGLGDEDDNGDDESNNNNPNSFADAEFF